MEDLRLVLLIILSFASLRMAWVTTIFNGGLTPAEYREDRLRQMFSIGSDEDLIPFVTTLFLQTGTADRSLTIVIDPPRRGSGTPAPIQAGLNQFEYYHGLLRVAVASDLTQLVVPVGMPITEMLTLLSSAAATWTLTFVYQLIPGKFAPNTQILTDLAARRRMDKFDTDEAGNNYFRMGQLRRMGDGEPGT